VAESEEEKEKKFPCPGGDKEKEEIKGMHNKNRARIL